MEDQLLKKFFTVRQTMVKCLEQNTDVHHLHTDLQAAYDNVWRKETWSGMNKLGFPKTINSSVQNFKY
jgi:hypothetical protein